jgi:hypothetical protein
MDVTTYCYGNTLAVRLAVASATTSAAAAERPLSVAFLLDNSGSMEGPRMDSVKRTLHAARSLSRPDDRVTLITFSETARVLLNHHPVGDATELFAAVDGIHADAATNLSAGIEALYGCGNDYDTVIVLTDGIVNVGITSTAGLRAMLLGGGAAGGLAFHALGYGADHNRSLLRDIATRSRGTYTFVDSDEILPIAMADVLSGARGEMFRDVRATPPAGWTSMEVGGECVGGMIAGRDYWTVFTATDGSAAPTVDDRTVVMVTAAGQALRSVRVEARPANDLPPEVLEQRLRARSAAAMIALSDLYEAAEESVTAAAATTSPRVELEAIRTEIEAQPADVRTRPLFLRLLGQIAEILAALPSASIGGGLRRAGGGLLRANAAMARLASGATVLSNQRGVYSSVSTVEDPAANVSFFSTPMQRMASQSVSASYSRRAEDEDELS